MESQDIKTSQELSKYFLKEPHFTYAEVGSQSQEYTKNHPSVIGKISTWINACLKDLSYMAGWVN